MDESVLSLDDESDGYAPEPVSALQNISTLLVAEPSQLYLSTFQCAISSETDELAAGSC